MENDTTISKEGLLEPVLSCSVTFESSILAPLHSNYLYEESKESFTYNSAQLIKNAALQKRYSAFRAEKRKHGYSEEELEESFGFLLLDDKSRANRLAETGLIVGQGTCTTLGDCSKGVYISKYSDCLDLKRWYDGKTGYIVLLKLTKGRVKEVTENYTQNFTPPTAGFDCHVSEQLQAVCATTSFFLAFERTQYYLYELVDGVEKVEPCPRHVCPFAIVAFSYGKTGISLELKEKSQEKSSFHYQPWSGQLQIESVFFNIGLKSNHGAMFPANLPKTVKVDRVIEVSALRKILPQAVFESSPVNEVSLDGKWFSMYDVVSFEARNDLDLLTQGLKEKDLALVICLEDGGFLVFLHSSNFLSYEGAGTDKAFALQGMFVYPASRTVPRETKSGYHKTNTPLDVLQVLPALNYAELEMEKCPPKQDEEPLGIMEKHLQNFAALIFPGLTSSPSREASMFPDQYDVPDGFPLIAPKLTEQTGNRLRIYLNSPCSFQIPLARAQELLAAGKQQRSDDQDDDVYYCISSPDAPQSPADLVMERDLPNETDTFTCINVSEDVKKIAELQAESELTAAEQSVLIEAERYVLMEVKTPCAAVVETPDNNPVDRADPSPMSGDLPTEHYTQNIQAVETAQDSEKSSECVSANDRCGGESSSMASLTETVQTTSVTISSSETRDDASTVASNSEMEVDLSHKVNCVSDILPMVGGQIPATEKLQEADLPTSISPPTTSVNRTEALIEGCKEIQPEASSNIPAKSKPNRRGKRRRRKGLKRNTNKVSQITTPLQNTTVLSSPSTEATPELSSSSETIHSSPSTLKKDWRSLPRRKRHWNADASTKRTLRSDLKSSETPCGKTDETEKTTTITNLTVTTSMPSTPKRKMEGITMRERYGLKTIITDCGFVFVPHGSEVAPGDIKSNENQQAQESSSVTTSSPIGEKPTTSPTRDKPHPLEMENTSQHMPQTHIQNISANPAKAQSSGEITENVSVCPENSDQSSVLDSTEKTKSTAKDHVYRAISISKLKTVLKRSKRTKSPTVQNNGKSISDNTEPKLKRGKPNSVELPDKGKQESTFQHDPESTENQEPVENTPSKPLPRTNLSQEMRSSESKENGFRNKEGKNGWKFLPSLPGSAVKAKVWSSLFLRCRTIVEKEGSIQVTRHWKENYDFKFDSKFTNDKLDKCVTRALHGDWDFSIEDSYEQVHLIFHMWIGLFYSKPTSRFFHFDQICPSVDKKILEKASQCAVQTSTSLPDVELTLKVDKLTSVDPVSDALDLSVKVPGTEDDFTTGENLTPTSGIRSRFEHTPDISPSLDNSLKVPPASILMDYRSTVEDEKCANDPNDCSDTEDDTSGVVESTYTQLLESNSAYNQLCGLASNMRIEVQKLLNVQKNEPVSKDLSISKAMNLGTETKSVAVFHQVVAPVKPLIISKVPDTRGFKFNLKLWSFKEKNKDEAPVSVHRESVSKDEQREVQVNKEIRENTSACAHSGNNEKNESVLKTKPGCCSVISVSVSDTNDASTEFKSALLTRDETPTVIHDKNSSATEKSVSERNNEVVCNDIEDTSVDEFNVSIQTKQDITSPRDVRNDNVETHVNEEVTENVGPVPEVIDEIPVDIIKPFSHDCSNTTREVLNDDQKKDNETPVTVRIDTSVNVPDVVKSQELVTTVRDDTSSHDARNDMQEEVNVNDETDMVATMPDTGDILPEYDEENTADGECDEDANTSDEVHSLVNIRDASADVQAEDEDELGVVDDIPVVLQDMNNTNKNATLELDARADMSADVQDVNKSNKEARSGLDVRDDKPSNIQDVLQNETTTGEDEAKCQPDVKDCSSLVRPHDVDSTEDMEVHVEISAMEDHVSEKDERNVEAINIESVRKTAAEPLTESDSVENSTFAESQDRTGSVDMSDMVSETENSVTVHAVNVPRGERDLEAFEEDSLKLQEGEIKTDTLVASNCKEHTREGARSGISEYSSADHMSSTSSQIINLEESYSLSAVGGPCIPKQNDDESDHDACVVQHETPGVNLDKPTKCLNDVLPITEKGKPEPYELKDSSEDPGSSENDLDVFNAHEESSKDPSTLELGTEQKPFLPTVYNSIVNSFELHKNFHSIDASPPTLQIDTEAEMNSNCCTPTLDEPTYHWADEVSNIQEGNLQDISETGHYCVKNSSTNAWLALESSDDSDSDLKEAAAPKEQIVLQDSLWSYNKHNSTVKDTDESQTFSTDINVPEEKTAHFDCESVPTPRTTKEIEPQHDQFGSFSEHYEDDSYEELPSSWTHGANFKRKQPNEWYAPDGDTHYTNSTSVRREVAYRPREITESNSDTPGWAQRTRYSESVPKADESNERVLSFRPPAGLSESNEESESQGSEPVRYSKKKHKRRFCQNDRGKQDFYATVDLSIKKTFSCSSDRSSISRTRTSSPYQHKGGSKQPFDWRRYFRREGIFMSKGDNSDPFHDPPSSIITMFDKKGNRVIFESPSSEKRLAGIHGASQNVEEQQSNSVTQSLMELEYLVFSEKMTHLLKNYKTTSRAKHHPRLNISPVEKPMTIQFSRLDEQNSYSALDQTWPTLSKFKINVDMSERKASKKTPNYSKPLHLQSLFCKRGTEATCSKLSDITKECSKSYHTLMNDICIGKTVPHQNEELKRKWDSERVRTSKQSGFCGRIKKDMFDHLHDNLNSIVRQACRTKYKFYIFVTSADPFFEETKDLLEAEGHTAVEPYQFESEANGQTPLLIILRNEDIAEHIFEVPHLLELKKSPRVLFVGIDQPDDVVNLTHQELFAKGGFVVFDETALETLSLENMKKFVGIMEELDKKGKWKWFLHYRDSRKFRENARGCPEAQRRKQFIDCCQEAGIVEVLPYHECDVISRDKPDFLRCLVRLQIQNISARFPIFITDKPDESFEKNGILTMNIYTFSRILSSDTCSVS
ncbi:uncharacterized protein tasor2 isoform X2 [Tachysurus fulvidraco]|uniref:uncharacterized protein tasor2 isoform X2 n=1 Tax=Tachysurus fulvidraco TaxID=1234273 RepID=UPI001FEE2370|nr:uncharacterized protein tasor2 isoform X2 [Tachysurus fulvidraco]